MFETIQFSSLGEFFEMGGYAFNVWSVYMLFILFFFINLYFPLLKKKQIIREQKRRLVVSKESTIEISET
ncbi:MAG: heme exporter protein CcmD [Pseudomonadales bacterium]|nr:heme exporter protein CcmD [Pseudomonadales bacterium]